MCAEQDKPSILLIEYGSWTTKIGKPGDKQPQCFSSIYSTTDNTLFGDDVTSKPELTKTADFLLNEEGNIKNFELIEKFTNYCLNRSNISEVKNKSIFNFRNVNMTNDEILKLAQMAFENYEASRYFMAKSNVLTLYAYGQLTGVCLNIGHNISSTTVVSQGFAIDTASKHCNVAGNSINTKICAMLAEHGCQLDSKLYSTQLLLDNLKKCNLKYSSIDSKQHIPEQIYSLPDGVKIIQNIMDQSAAIINTTPLGLVDDVIQISGLPQNELYNSIILSGGSTLFDKCHLSIKSAIENKHNNQQTVNIQYSPYVCHNASFIGGSILTSLPDMEKHWVTRAEYLENGPSFVIKKCV